MGATGIGAGFVSIRSEAGLGSTEHAKCGKEHIHRGEKTKPSLLAA